jgi:hypothetical protein
MPRIGLFLKTANAPCIHRAEPWRSRPAPAASLDRVAANGDTSSMPGRSAGLLIALLLVSGCAGDAAEGGRGDRAAWTRLADHAPWFMSGLSPTADSIRFALYDDVYGIDAVPCPFARNSCAAANRPADRELFEVERVRCRATAEEEDRCRFTLVELGPDGARIRSRCTGRFEIVGTSDYPSRWGVKYGDYDDPLLTCRR